MSSAGLDHLRQLFCPQLKRSSKTSKRRQQVLYGLQICADMERRRDHIIRRLAEVNVVIRMDLPRADLLSHELRCPVGDNLVCVHVSRCAGPCLKDVDGEVLVPSARRNLVSSLPDSACPVAFKKAEL